MKTILVTNSLTDLMTSSLVTAKNICRTELVLKMTRTKKANEERSVDRKMMLKRRIFTDSLCSTGGPAMSVGISMRALLHRRTRNVCCHVNEGYVPSEELHNDGRFATSGGPVAHHSSAALLKHRCRGGKVSL